MCAAACGLVEDGKRRRFSRHGSFLSPKEELPRGGRQRQRQAVDLALPGSLGGMAHCAGRSGRRKGVFMSQCAAGGGQVLRLPAGEIRRGGKQLEEGGQSQPPLSSAS
eukprot:scaffold139221_cov35-Tisochrysis_lutea.AAC.1